MKQFLILFLFISSSLTTFAQDQFERLYRATDRDHLTLDVAQTSDDGYLILSLSDSSDIHQVANVTKLDDKGNFSWSQDYEFDEVLEKCGDLVVFPTDTFAFTVVEKQSNLNKIITKVAPGGEVVWSKGIGRMDTEPQFFYGYSEMTTVYDGGLGLTGHLLVGDETEIYAARTDTLGELFWAKALADFDDIGRSAPMDIKSTRDSGFIVCGNQFVNASSNVDAFLIKMDSLGNIEWSRKYGENNAFDVQRANAVVETPDNGFAFAGSEIIGDFPPQENGFVVKVDSLGKVQWYSSLDLDGVFTSRAAILNMVLSNSNELVVSGRGSNVDSAYAFVAAFDLDGNPQWDQKYKRVSDNSFLNDGLITTSDGGFAHANSGQDSGDDNSMPYLLKLDGMGTSSCEDSLTIFYTLFDTIPTDTIAFTSNDLDESIDKEPIDTSYNSFNLVILALQSPPPFCEGEPIEWTFDATVEGAVSYEWSTGETTPMITVFEEGQFIVNVRIEEDICYNLCDTAFISTIGPPTVMISPALEGFCLNGFGLLGAEIEAAELDSVVWSTGELNLQTIQVDAPGSYSVTAFNRCGVGSDSFTFTEFPEVLPTVNISVVQNDICTGGEAVLLGEVFNQSSFNWSTGETANTITVVDAGTYSITAENICGETTNDVTLSEDAPTGTLDFPEAFQNCDEETAIMIVNSPDAQSFSWSTGQSGTGTDFPDTLFIDSQGDYSVTLANACGETTLDETFACIFLIDDCIRLPNAFTPNGDDVNNDFGPIVLPECADEFTVTNFQVWNRWGQKVFESNNGERWDGEQSGDPAVPDVYIYLIEVESEDDDLPKTFKGDVTLIR